MTDRSNRGPGPFTLEEVCAVIEIPQNLPSFLAANRMSDKFRRQADDHHREAHGLARTVIQAIDGAKNRDDLIKALKAQTNLRKVTELPALVLDALIEYRFPKDAQFFSQDKGIQRHLQNLSKDGVETPIFIKSLGGVRATYDAYRDAKRGNAKKEKKIGTSLEMAVLQTCPDLNEGEYVAIIARAAKRGRLELVSAKKSDSKSPAIAMDETHLVSIPQVQVRDAKALLKAH